MCVCESVLNVSSKPPEPSFVALRPGPPCYNLNKKIIKTHPEPISSPHRSEIARRRGRGVTTAGRPCPCPLWTSSGSESRCSTGPTRSSTSSTSSTTSAAGKRFFLVVVGCLMRYILRNWHYKCIYIFFYFLHLLTIFQSLG